MAAIVNKARPWFRAKLFKNAPTSVAAWTGTATRTTVATGSATATNVAEGLKALIDDLRTAGVIK
jgi:hypothetical protein